GALAAGRPVTKFPTIFTPPYSAVRSTPLVRGAPATTDGATDGADPWTGGPASPFAAAFQWNGAVGLAPEVVNTVNISDLVQGPIPAPASAPGCPAPTANTVTAY